MRVDGAGRLLFIAAVCGGLGLPPGTAAANGGCPCATPPPRKPSPLVTRAYPVCFFNARPDERELEKLPDKMRIFLAPYMPANTMQLGASPDGRWLSLKARQSAHSAIKKVWPRIGCHGGYTSEQDYVVYRRCVVYLTKFMDQPRYDFGGDRNDGDGISGQLFCDGK